MSPCSIDILDVSTGLPDQQGTSFRFRLDPIGDKMRISRLPEDRIFKSEVMKSRLGPRADDVDGTESTTPAAGFDKHLGPFPVRVLAWPPNALPPPEPGFQAVKSFLFPGRTHPGQVFMLSACPFRTSVRCTLHAKVSPNGCHSRQERNYMILTS